MIGMVGILLGSVLMGVGLYRYLGLKSKVLATIITLFTLFFMVFYGAIYNEVDSTVVKIILVIVPFFIYGLCENHASKREEREKASPLKTISPLQPNKRLDGSPIPTKEKLDGTSKKEPIKQPVAVNPVKEKVQLTSPNNDKSTVSAENYPTPETLANNSVKTKIDKARRLSPVKLEKSQKSSIQDCFTKNEKVEEFSLLLDEVSEKSKCRIDLNVSLSEKVVKPSSLRVEFTYSDYYGDVTTRQIDVISLSRDQVQGFCLLREKVRTFNIDSIVGDITNIDTGEISSVDDWMLSNFYNEPHSFYIGFRGFPKDERLSLEQIAKNSGYRISRKVDESNFIVYGKDNITGNIAKLVHSGMPVLSKKDFFAMLN